MIGRLHGLAGVEIQERLDEALPLGQQVCALVVVARVAADGQAAAPEPDVRDPKDQGDDRDREQSNAETRVDDQTLDGGLIEHGAVKAVVLYESMTGNTQRVAELIGGALAAAGDDVAVHAVTDFDFHELAVADVVFVGTWVDGLVLFGQRPGRAGRLRKLPVLDRKPVAVFCTYAINAGKALDKTVEILETKGALIAGQHQFRRDRLDQGVGEFVDEVRAKVRSWNPALSNPE
jgi:hypothetical protein